MGLKDTPTGLEPDIDNDNLLVERVRRAIWVVFVGTAFLALGELALRFGENPWISIAHITCLSALLSLLAILPRVRGRRARIAVALTSTGIAATTSAAIAVLSAQSTTSMIVLVGLAMGAAAFVPWGGTAQLIAVSMLGIAYPVEVYLNNDGRIPLAHSRDLIGLYVVLAGSVYLANEIERHRRIAAREQMQRRQREAEIERQRAFLYQVIDSDPHFIFAKDRDGRFTLVNQAVAEVYGSRVADLIGKTDADFNSNREEVENFRRDDLEVIDKQQEKYIAEEVITDARGQRRFLETIKRPLVGLEGRADQMLGVATDITIRKIAEERLRTEGEITATLAHVGREIIGSLSRPGALPRLCQLTAQALGGDRAFMWFLEPEFGAFVPAASFGSPPERWEAMRVLRIDRETFLQWHEGLELGEPVFATRDQVQRRAPPPLRTLVPECSSFVAIPLMRGGDVNGAVTLGFNERSEPLTEAQTRIAQGLAQLASLALENARLVDELDRANQLKSEFVATMSHELRTPLNVILGYDTLLRDGAMGEVNQDQKQTLERIHENALQLLSLVTATLDMSRLEAGRVRLDLQIVDLSNLMAELEAQMYEARSKPGVRFRWRVGADVPLLHTDAIKLKVILTNLVSNALKFTSEGHVTATAVVAGDQVQIEVVDTGIGIAPSAQAAIFEPFRQGDRSIGERYGGVGLGLYIARRLVEILNGTIAVESEEGVGSTFRVRVPLRLRSQTAAPSSAAA
jgi:PAS domain S-box-containing protein